MKQRRRYTPEFKAEAVRLVLESGRPVAQIARELGIPDQVLHRWKQKAQGGGSGDGEIVPERLTQDEELRRLRRELLRVTEERDILKKAVAFFANQNR